MNREITKAMIDETTMNEMIASRKERRYGGFKFDDNLFRFFHEMHVRGYEVTYMSAFGEAVRDCYNDLDEVAYQSQNYEGCNVTMTHYVTRHKQTVAVDYTGDAWCDVVPIINWTMPRDHPDVVRMVIDMIREDVLGDDA